MNKDDRMTKFKRSDIFDSPCMSMADFNHSDYDKCFAVSKGSLYPYILPEEAKLKYNRDGKKL